MRTSPRAATASTSSPATTPSRPCAGHDLWPATYEVRDAEAALMPGASLAYVGPGDPQATFEPAPGEDPFEAYPVAVANEFFSDGRAVELRAAEALSFETLCEADIVQ